MNLIEKTKLIQSKVGAAADGIYGSDTADKVDVREWLAGLITRKGA